MCLRQHAALMALNMFPLSATWMLILRKQDFRVSAEHHGMQSPCVAQGYWRFQQPAHRQRALEMHTQNQHRPTTLCVITLP